MTVVGLDLSTNYSGFALFEDGKYVSSELLDCHTIKHTEMRVKQMVLKIEQKLDETQPDVVMIEECLLKTNVQTVKLLSYLAGAVVSWCARNCRKLQFSMPSSWRKLVNIRQGPNIKREQLKKEAIELVEERYGLSVNDDVAESILLASSFFVY